MLFLVGHNTVFYPSKENLKNIFAVSDLGSSEMVVSCGCKACLKPETDRQVVIGIVYLIRVFKKIRDFFFNVPIEVRQSLVMLPTLIADVFL